MTNVGWICPRCGKVHAPWIVSCDCTVTYMPTPYVPIYPPSPWTPWYNMGGYTTSTLTAIDSAVKMG